VARHFVSFEYLSRAPLGKDTIYYLNASTRQLAEASPYYEAFKASGREVLFVYNTLDDFTLTNISNYNGREIRSAEALKPDDLDLADKADESGDEKKEGEEKAADGASTLKTKLTDDEAEALCEWLRDALSSKLRDVKTTDRLVGSPAIITQHESATLRKMMQQVDQAHSGTQASLGKQQLEVNAAHPVMVRLHALALNAASDDPAASESAELAQLAAEQVYNGVHMRICLPCPRDA
jgi:HSP90 family molecular chaperone